MSREAIETHTGPTVHPGRLARVGLFTDVRAASHRQLRISALAELLEHAGLPHLPFADPTLISVDNFDIIIAVDDPELRPKLDGFAEAGGAAIISACASPDEVGYAYLQIGETGGTPIRCIVGNTAGISESDCRGSIRSDTPSGEPIAPVVGSRSRGLGRIIEWQVDVGLTFVWLTQGSGPVVQDGIPAPDGSAPIDEGILKVEDGHSLDWDVDRQVAKDGSRFFGIAYADRLRELFLHELVDTAREQQLVLPSVAYLPDGVAGIVHVSLDSDHNLRDHARLAIELFRQLEITATWCVIPPGWGEDLHQLITNDGHELGLHYNAVPVDGGTWGRGAFTQQLATLRELTTTPVTTNKNHYLRFEGWDELYQWCDENGISCDQTRGPTKAGAAGLLFGTCHPFRPIGGDGAAHIRHNVIVLPLFSMDMDMPFPGRKFPTSAILEPLLTETNLRQGIAHFLFHPTFLAQQAVVIDALRRLVYEARQRQMVFWTARDIEAWERARRVVAFRQTGDFITATYSDRRIRILW